VFTVYDISRTALLSKIKTFSTVGDLLAAAPWALLCGGGGRGAAEVAEVHRVAVRYQKPR